MSRAGRPTRFGVDDYCSATTARNGNTTRRLSIFPVVLFFFLILHITRLDEQTRILFDRRRRRAHRTRRARPLECIQRNICLRHSPSPPSGHFVLLFLRIFDKTVETNIVVAYLFRPTTSAS